HTRHDEPGGTGVSTVVTAEFLGPGFAAGVSTRFVLVEYPVSLFAAKNARARRAVLRPETRAVQKCFSSRIVHRYRATAFAFRVFGTEVEEPICKIHARPLQS